MRYASGMEPTISPYIKNLLDDLLARLRSTLAGKLVGLYLHGSLVAGDFEANISDIDLLAALSDGLTEAELESLRQMHADFAAQYPQWDGRIEVAYLSLHALKTFKTQRSRIGIISPGEPLHLVEAGNEWSMNWYMVQEKGVTLYGPLPHSIIDPISRAEFIQVIRRHVLAWREYIQHGSDRPFQAYSILTLCRGLYTLTHGEQVSKIKAANWAQQQMPEWAELIQNALAWRLAAGSGQMVDHAATLPDTLRFVAAIIARVERDFPD